MKTIVVLALACFMVAGCQNAGTADNSTQKPVAEPTAKVTPKGTMPATGAAPEDVPNGNKAQTAGNQIGAKSKGN